MISLLNCLSRWAGLCLHPHRRLGDSIGAKGSCGVLEAVDNALSRLAPIRRQMATHPFGTLAMGGRKCRLSARYFSGLSRTMTMPRARVHTRDLVQPRRAGAGPRLEEVAPVWAGPSDGRVRWC
jgi:hypothetical protein